jgi:protein-tyrosine phosphatase
MIDLHVHILYGLDDGPGTLSESLGMASTAYEDGVRTMVATPHTLDGHYRISRSTVLAKVGELNKAMAECVAGSSRCECFENEVKDSSLLAPHPLPNVLPGADVRLNEETLPALDQGELTSLGDGGKYLLLEFPHQGIPHGAEEVLKELMKRGMTPVISHPERNPEIGRKPKRYYEMIRMGCLGQVTAMSLTGGFGAEVRRLAEKLVRYGLVHVIASDAHSDNGRPPILSSAVKEAEKIVGEAEARKMVTDYPRAILEGLKPSFNQQVK